jgi:hypothetical protein
VKELYDGTQCVFDRFRFGVLDEPGGLLFSPCDLCLVGFNQTGLFFRGFLLELMCECAETGELFFKLLKLGLQGGFLQDLGFLVRIEFSLGDKVIEGNTGVFADDGISFRRGRDFFVDVADVPGRVLSAGLCLDSGRVSTSPGP